MPNKIPEIKNDIIKLINVNKIAENIANLIDIKPDGIGLNFFIGCILSSFTSRESFNR